MYGHWVVGRERDVYVKRTLAEGVWRCFDRVELSRELGSDVQWATGTSLQVPAVGQARRSVRTLTGHWRGLRDNPWLPRDTVQ